MSIKLYNLAQLVKVNTNPVTVTNTDASQQRIKLYQGQTCSVNFSVFNSTNKPLSVAGTQLIFKIWNPENNELLKTKTITAIKNDVIKVSFDSNELMDIEPGYYYYTCNITAGDDENLILYMDTSPEHRGFLEIISVASNYIIPTTTLNNFNLYNSAYYSSAVNNVDKLRQRGSLHTYTVHTSGFTGTITAQATMLVAGTATTDADWFDVDNIVLSDYTGTSTGTFTGIYSQIRFKFVKTSGSVAKILYRS
jgi:WD40 repeat protein